MIAGYTCLHDDSQSPLSTDSPADWVLYAGGTYFDINKQNTTGDVQVKKIKSIIIHPQVCLKNNQYELLFIPRYKKTTRLAAACGLVTERLGPRYYKYNHFGLGTIYTNHLKVIIIVIIIFSYFRPNSRNLCIKMMLY